MSESRVSGPYDEFCEYDCLIALTEGAEGPGGVHKDVRQELDIDFGIDQTFRPLVVNHPSSCTSSLTNSESLTVTDTVSEIGVVSNECKIDSFSRRGTALVNVFKLTPFSGKLCIQNYLDQVLIQTDVSKKGWGAVCKRV